MWTWVVGLGLRGSLAAGANAMRAEGPAVKACVCLAVSGDVGTACWLGAWEWGCLVVSRSAMCGVGDVACVWGSLQGIIQALSVSRS